MSFFKYLYHFGEIPVLLLRVVLRLKRQKNFLRTALMPELQNRMITNDGTIDEEDIQKIKKYYGLAVPAILAEAYADLRGKPLSENERKAATYLGATTGLFDDFFDRKELTDEYVKNLYTFPEKFTGQNSNEQLCNFCWLQALAHATSASLLVKNATRVHAAQIESRRQATDDLPLNIIREITFDKGGYSVIFYLSLFYDTMPYEDEYLFYNAGALLQLENDIFDVYKDNAAGIKTLVTSAKNIHHLREIYQAQWQKVKVCINAAQYAETGKRKFEKILCALVSRGFVCLDMLQLRAEANDGIFNPHAFTRKQLICDMEKPINLWRTMQYYALMY